VFAVFEATISKALRGMRYGPSELRGARGFTFLELLLVLIMLGILFSLAIPSMKGITPKYRLRTAARQLGSQIEELRITAISRGYWVGIHYRLEGERSTYQVIPPPPADYPDQPIENRSFLSRVELPPGVGISRIRLRGTNELITSGTVSIYLSPAGTMGSHSVTFVSNDGRYLTLEFNAITGNIDFFESEDSSFEDFEG
jgi:prepilin-type N-terminal cleavage/methylation domain-containing protein